MGGRRREEEETESRRSPSHLRAGIERKSGKTRTGQIIRKTRFDALRGNEEKGERQKEGQKKRKKEREEEGNPMRKKTETTFPMASISTILISPRSWPSSTATGPSP